MRQLRAHLDAVTGSDTPPRSSYGGFLSYQEPKEAIWHSGRADKDLPANSDKGTLKSLFLGHPKEQIKHPAPGLDYRVRHFDDQSSTLSSSVLEWLLAWQTDILGMGLTDGVFRGSGASEDTRDIPGRCSIFRCFVFLSHTQWHSVNTPSCDQE